ITANWHPIPWLTLNGVTGLDHIHQLNQGVVPPDQVFAPGYQNGLEEEDRSHFDILTFNWSGAAQFPLSNALRTTFTAGTQYYWKKAEGWFSTNATGATLSTQQGAQQKTLGGLLSAQLGWRDRVFLTAALRSDWSGGFEHEYGAVLYPALM